MKRTPKRILLLVLQSACALAVSVPAWAQPEVVTAGLQGPQRMILTPQRNLLVSETSKDPDAGRISAVSRSGMRRTLFDGLPSGVEVTLAGGSGPTAMALTDRTLYVAIGAGDAERRGAAPGTSMHNPEGVSSPLFASIWEIRLNLDVDLLSGPFMLTQAHQHQLADGRGVEVSDGAGGSAAIAVLTRFPVADPDPRAIYRFSNPWGMTLSADGEILYVADASKNMLVAVETATGRWKTVARFPPLPNPTPFGPPVVDAVPTSVRVFGDELLVSFLSGFPFAPDNARVVIVDPETGQTRPLIYWHTSVTDVLWRDRGDARAQFFVLEFSRNQSAQPPPPGRLVRYDSTEAITAAPTLIAPVSLAFDESTQELYILELTGRILKMKVE